MQYYQLAAYFSGVGRKPGLVPDERIGAAKTTMDQPTDAEALAAMIGDFFRRTVHDELA